MLAAKPTMFDSANCLAQTLIDHGVGLDEVAAAPKPPKESGGKKKKFWNKHKGLSSQEPSKKQ